MASYKRSKEEKRAAADALKAEAAERTPQQQVERLCGLGLAAKKELARLVAKIAAGEKPAPTTKKEKKS